MLTSATTVTAIEGTQAATAGTPHRDRSTSAQRAQTLLKRVEDLLAEEDYVSGVFSQHLVSRYRWASDMARAVMDRVRAGTGTEDLHWLFYDLIEDYFLHVFENPLVAPADSAEERETVAWMRSQLGLGRD